jgi:hypothetical protein
MELFVITNMPGKPRLRDLCYGDCRFASLAASWRFYEESDDAPGLLLFLLVRSNKSAWFSSQKYYGSGTQLLRFYSPSVSPATDVFFNPEYKLLSACAFSIVYIRQRTIFRATLYIRKPLRCNLNCNARVYDYHINISHSLSFTTL